MAWCNIKFDFNTILAATVEFEEVRKGLEDKSVIYMDVRNRSELETDGKVVGSINLPCKYTKWLYSGFWFMLRLTMVFCLVPEIIEAFSNDDQEFEKKYGFAKLDKSAGSKIVVACLGGKRAAAAAEQLQQIGFEGVR